jgi:hypothetical protein
VFEWTVNDGPFQPIGILYESMTIAPATDASVTPYGCGVNPPGSLVLLSGEPSLGSPFTLGIDNPVGTQTPGNWAILTMAVAPDPAYPCGTPIPGFGMAVGGGPGELLLASGVASATWANAPWFAPGVSVPFALGIPAKAEFVGLTVYFQGVMYDLAPTTGPEFALTACCATAPYAEG